MKTLITIHGVACGRRFTATYERWQEPDGIYTYLVPGSLQWEDTNLVKMRYKMPDNLKELSDLLCEDVFTDAPEYEGRVERICELKYKIAEVANGIRYLNGSRVIALTPEAVFIRIPPELWRPAGRCWCSYCHGAEAFWDTLAVPIKQKDGHLDTCWTVHCPEPSKVNWHGRPDSYYQD